MSSRSTQDLWHLQPLVTRTWTNWMTQTQSERKTMRTKITGGATETETIKEKTRTTDRESTQKITGPPDLSILNTQVAQPPSQPPSSPTESVSLSLVTQDAPETPPSSPSSTSHSSDDLWAQVEDLSGLIDGIDLGT
ncbi:uncharacterized protein F5891DRAFT_1183494 [Suillus fuscotomentosus]|uniref:Uncharacterized protein n=1 Tax=Suillus fuscotomentosus TaxID=1912939 RepID=A0AAD4HQS0_9AGAM|nr:uncharacterized protein F5891DRAFT_1183494 [Suillus fuscotomentosus]KAG1905548.1 hypothetical protein F5891DRAFT_1183494 [Suillus fuscotomentosus]